MFWPVQKVFIFIRQLKINFFGFYKLIVIPIKPVITKIPKKFSIILETNYPGVNVGFFSKIDKIMTHLR